MSEIEKPYMKRAFIASLKRTAQNLNADITKKNKLVEKMAEMQAEVDMINMKIETWDKPIKAVTGGYGTEELIDKVVEDAGVDKNGKVIKSTKFVLKYPKTIIPPQETTGDETVINQCDAPGCSMEECQEENQENQEN